MRILYGVQGTGNGHLTRARAMATALVEHPHADVQFLISGREQTRLFGIQPLGDYWWRDGLSFATRNGRVSVVDTISHNPWWKFWHDVHHLDLSSFDLVVTDFEPVTAWAAKRQGVPCIGLGRQYAFTQAHSSLPSTALQRAMIKQFAPCQIALGTHWRPLNDYTLPPIIEPADDCDLAAHANRYLVYLPFEPLAEIADLLVQLHTLVPHYTFDVFHPEATAATTPNAVFHAPSRSGFQQAFAPAQGVISNAGFGTSSEALAAGKKLLIKPLKGQFEQYANAHYLDAQKLATVCLSLDAQALLAWLKEPDAAQLSWPQVAPQLAQWLTDPRRGDVRQLAQRLWSQTLDTRRRA